MSDAIRDRVIAAIGDQYDIESEIGRGGMSVVYCARDLRLNRQVAVKVLPPELAFDRAVRERFMREAQTAAQLSHPSIVPIYSVDERGGFAYFVMGLVRGGNLAALLARTPYPPLAGVRRLLLEVADALAYAHARGVIHRDIKPDNILLDPEGGRAVVTDFGIARAMEEGSRLTVTGVAVGTPAYMSPEQAVGERDVDRRTDIYSLGIVGYQMLAGAQPFVASNTPAMLMKQVSEAPRPLSERRRDLPRALCEIIERALAKAPAQRWQSADALRDALERVDLGRPGVQLHSVPVGARSSLPPRLRSRREQKRERQRERDEERERERERRDRQPVVRHWRATAEEAEQGEQERAREEREAKRRDRRLWRGATTLRERISRFRRGAAGAALLGAASAPFILVGMAEEVPPAFLAGIPAFVMMLKTAKRARWLRRLGIGARTALFNPAAAVAQVEGEPPSPAVDLTAGLAPRDVLDGPHGLPVRQAAEDRAAIVRIVERLPAVDRELLPDVGPTVDALVHRVAALAQTLHRLDASLSPGMMERLDVRIGQVEAEPVAGDRDRRLALLQRQRSTLADLLQRRAMLASQLESAGLTLANLRLDLLKLRESGVHAALHDLASATQEARALSREIGTVLEAAADVKGL